MEKQKSENKVRTATWLYPKTFQRMDANLEKANCKSRSELIENALDFYLGYLDSQSATTFLGTAILGAIEGTLYTSENRTSNNLFRLAIEINMMMHLLATTLEITDEELRSLRGRCVREVKSARGNIKVDDAIRFQQGGGE